MFTGQDNEKFLKLPTLERVKKVVSSSNLYAAPGTDGIPSLLYKECWAVLGNPLTDVMVAIHDGQSLQESMQTSLMVFGSKPKKAASLLPGDKRKISLLNADFKTATGLDAQLLKESSTHTLSPLQLVAGEDRRIHHGINLARNAIYVAGKPGHQGCGILDTDLIAAFDFMCLDCVFEVLKKKGLDDRVIARLKNLYRDNMSLIVVNNIPGKLVKNIRLSIRQGDLPSMHLFSFGIDPVLSYLEKRLNGILIASLPVHGPALAGCPPLVNLEERFKVIGYADDVKPAITCMNEFIIVDKAMELFEQASGCRLHRDPASKKCKFLPLARWRGTLQQSDIPCNYMSISDHLDMLGVELRSTWVQTRKANGDEVQDRVEKTTRLWRSGKFMHLSLRSWSLNSYCLSKVWFKTHCVDLRQLDTNKILSSIKSWLYADQYLKPEEIVMFRPASYGGLGIHHVKYKALAALTRTFLETAGNPKFKISLFHSNLFRFHILQDNSIPNPGFPPFYTQEFFQKIHQVKNETPLNILTMTEKQWYQVYLEDNCTMTEDEQQQRTFISTRTELSSPSTDWERTWRLSRQRGLGPELTTFLFRMMHRLLVTKERQHRTNPATSPTCSAVGCEEVETMQHALLHCQANRNVGMALLQTLRQHQPTLSAEAAARLELDIPEEEEVPSVWLLAATFLSVWEQRQSSNRVQPYLVRAQLEARVNLLRMTRFEDEAAIILEKIQYMFENC